MEIRKLTWVLEANENLAGAIGGINEEVDKIKEGLPSVKEGVEDIEKSTKKSGKKAAKNLNEAFESIETPDLDIEVPEDAIKVPSVKKSIFDPKKSIESIDKFTKAASKKLSGFADKTKKLSLGAGALGTAGVKSAMDYGEKLQFAGTQGEMDDDDMRELSEYVKSMEKRSTSLELMDAAGVYASAGLKKDQIMGVMEATEQVSRVAGDSEVATDLFLISEVAFGADLTNADEVKELGDKFSKGSSMAKLEMNEMVETLAVAQGTFRNMNMDVGDSVAMMTLMAKAGMRGSEAGTSMNSVYRELVAKAEDGVVAFGDFELQLYDAEGKMKTMPVLLSEISDGIGEMSPKLQNAALNEVFGANAIKTVNAFMGEGSEAFNAMMGDVDKAEGELEKKYDRLGESTKERMAAVKSTMIDAGLELGEALLPLVEKVGETVKSVADSFNSLDDGTKETIGKVVVGVAMLSPALSIGSKLVGVFGGLGKGLIKLIEFGGKLPILGSAFSKIGGVVSGVGSKLMGFVAANPLSLLAVGAVAGGVLLYKNWDKVKAKAEELGGKVKEKWGNIKDSIGESVQNAKESVKEGWENIKTGTKETWENVKTSVSDTWDNIKERTSDAVEGVKTSISERWESLKEGTKETWDNIKTSVSDTWDDIKTRTKETAEGIKETVGEKWENLKETTSDKWESIKETTSDKWETIKTNVAGKATEIKDDTEEKLEIIKETVGDKWESIKETTGEKAGQIAETVSDKWEGLKTTASDKLQDTKETVGFEWENIKAALSGDAEGKVKVDDESFAGKVIRSKERWGELKGQLEEKIQGYLGMSDEEFQSAKSRVETGWGTLKGLLFAPITSTVKMANSLFMKGKGEVSRGWSGLKKQLSERLTGKVGILKNKFEEGVKTVRSKWEELKSFFKNPIQGTVNIMQTVRDKVSDIRNSFAVGATEVPRDMPANIHKGETILPKSTAKVYRALGGTRHRIPVMNGGGGGATINPTIDIHINGASDPKAVAREVKSEMEKLFIKLNKSI